MRHERCSRSSTRTPWRTIWANALASFGGTSRIPRRSSLYAELREPVDVLVNCAGFMELVSFAGTSWELGRALIDVDLISPLRLMSLAVPGMRARGEGLVVNVASMAGLVPLRGSSYYGAAKAGLAMASEVARIELARDGVHVMTVYPAPSPPTSRGEPELRSPEPGHRGRSPSAAPKSSQKPSFRARRSSRRGSSTPRSLARPPRCSPWPAGSPSGSSPAPRA